MSQVLVMTDELPRIYVASLSDYNAGRLHGRWIDAHRGADAIREDIDAMLAESREPVAEEWAIHDYDNFWGYAVPEFASVEHVSEVATLLIEHGQVFARLLNHFGGHIDDARGCMENAYRGEHESLAAYAQELAEELYGKTLDELPAFIRGHVDWDAVGHDLELGGDILTVECGGSLHVFDGQW